MRTTIASEEVIGDTRWFVMDRLIGDGEITAYINEYRRQLLSFKPTYNEPGMTLDDRFAGLCERVGAATVLVGTLLTFDFDATFVRMMRFRKERPDCRLWLVHDRVHWTEHQRTLLTWNYISTVEVPHPQPTKLDLWLMNGPIFAASKVAEAA